MRAIEEMINQRVNAALEAHQVNQNLALGNNNGNGIGNGNGDDNGNGKEMVIVETTEMVTKLVMAVGGSEKMENCVTTSATGRSRNIKVKYATCTVASTVHGTWWNSHKRPSELMLHKRFVHGES
ncbi:hypothetical protein Tco_0820721 [Tanacetum coccineum]|uniref:Uncharacterized protein n=1 Tax=Tanacetum coccineum TaxID=301880 RepID=A0ABQ5ACV6_9ASTR